MLSVCFGLICRGSTCVTPNLMARLAMLAMLAAADGSEPRPGGIPPWLTMFAIAAILPCSWSSTLYWLCKPLLPGNNRLMSARGS